MVQIVGLSPGFWRLLRVCKVIRGLNVFYALKCTIAFRLARSKTDQL